MIMDFRPDPTIGKNEEQLAALEETNRARLEGWWGLLGEPPGYPADTETVVRLLTAVEYDVSPDTLLGYLNDQSIPPVGRIAGRLSWSAVNIVTAACALEARRRWKPFSTIHAAKFSMV